jgi:CRP-like cAMP-binding protein
MTENEAKALIRNHGWLAEEAGWLQEAVLARARLRHFATNEFTFHAEDDPGGIFGVVSGGFGILLPSAAKEMVMVHVVRLGVWFGHGPVLTGRPRSMSFRASEPSAALHLPMSGVAEIRARHPEFGQRLAALSERNYSVVATRVIGDLLLPTSERRIAACLARISRPEKSEERLPPWPIHLTQADLGRMANTSRDRASLALRKFAANGWIDVEYKGIRVTDLDALEAFASKRDTEF